MNERTIEMEIAIMDSYAELLEPSYEEYYGENWEEDEEDF